MSSSKSTQANSSVDYSEIRKIAITAIFSDDFLFERVVLRGGNALSLALGMSRRTSLDLDFSIENDFEDLEAAGNRIRRALEGRFLAAGLVVFDFRFEAKPSVVPPGQSPRWGGYLAAFKVTEKDRFESLKAYPSARRRSSLVIGPGQQRVFTIDLSKYEYVSGKLEVELGDYTIYVYSPTMIAIEKLRAICQQMAEYPFQRHPSARARDFYDIHLIISLTSVDLSSPESLDLIAQIFSAKEVPLELLGRIANQREFHRPDWDSVKATANDVELAGFDYYFDFVLRRVSSIKSLWEK